jgi:phosphohistidine swiveling domain-containing protein
MHQPTPWIFSFGDGQADGGNEVKHLVGGKGASLGDMTRAGLNVPPGFTISAACCDLFYQRQQTWPDGLLDQVRDALTRLEKLAGRSLGQGDNPLLVAVRSGAAQSMPGMMDTILNVGLNADCVRAMARRSRDPRGAWEAYYHFLLMYGRTVCGPQKLFSDADLEKLVHSYLEETKAARLEDLDAGQSERLCERVLAFFRSRSESHFPSDPWDMLTGAILAVFRSWNSERAVAYRKHHKLEGVQGTAVNVQMMCPSEVSGVMFTTNPVQVGVEEIVIESSFGLGEAIVLGKVTPDTFVLDKKTLDIRARRISKKDYVLRTVTFDAEPSVNHVAARAEASLDDRQITSLARLGLRVEDYFKAPSDIEWGLAGGTFYLLQARPIKLTGPAIPADERAKVRQEEIAALRALAEPRGTVWARFNLAEILPEPTPMTWAIVRRFMSGQGGFGQMYRDMGFDPDPALDDIGIFDLVCGRPYCNLSREPRMQYRSLPFEHSFKALKEEPSKALYPQATPNFARAGWKFWLSLPLFFARMAWSSWKLQGIERTFAAKFRNEIVPRFLDEVRSAEKEEVSTLPAPKLLEKLEYWTKRILYDFARDSLKPTALAALALANMEATLAARLKPFARDASKEAEAVAKGAQRAQGFVRELAMNVHPERDSNLAGGLRDLSAGMMDRAEFLKYFGHRGSVEMELSRPRWSEDLAGLDRATAQRGEQPAAAMPSAEEKLQQVWERLSLEAHLMRFQQLILEEDVKVLHEYLKLRETAKHHLMRGYALIRRFLVELDRRYDLAGGIFFLTPDELPRLIALAPGDAGLAPLRQSIAERQRRRQIALSLPVPQVIFSDNLDAIGTIEDIQGTDVLQGVPLSAGVAEGSAWVLQEADDGQPPADDYILVCPSTDPAWVPLFVKARGLVMETGGVLSHGAIVAREFGLPAVAGISDVHRRLKTGQRLRVDGATGRVNVLS